MGEPQTPYFYDFGTFKRVPEPQNQLFFFGDTKIPNINRGKPWNIFKVLFL